MVALDHSGADEVVTSKQAMGDLLPGGVAEAEQRGRITLDSVTAVASSLCGM